MEQGREGRAPLHEPHGFRSDSPAQRFYLPPSVTCQTEREPSSATNMLPSGAVGAGP
jgi:hypothetical protein